MLVIWPVLITLILEFSLMLLSFKQHWRTSQTTYCNEKSRNKDRQTKWVWETKEECTQSAILNWSQHSHNSFNSYFIFLTMRQSKHPQQLAWQLIISLTLTCIICTRRLKISLKQICSQSNSSQKFAEQQEMYEACCKSKMIKKCMQWICALQEMLQ